MLQDQVLAGRYRLTEELGVGGMAVVWKAHDELLNRHVAVKVLAGAQTAAPAARRRVLAEAQAAAQVQHPHVANIYDYGEATEGSGHRVPYVVMELLPGRTLSQRLAAGPLPPRAALRVCAEVAAALAAAHARNVVHRDVKPANVILTPSGAKVVDFGLAAIAGQPDLDEDGQLLGTAAYLAPERLTGDEVLPASDVYALGLLIHRALTDELPWEADTPSQMLNAHVYVEPEPLTPMPGVPGEVNEICDRCLAKDPADRPPAAEVAAVLAAAAGIAPPPTDELPEAVAPSMDELPEAAAPSADDLFTIVVPLPAPAAPVAGAPDPGRRRRTAVVAVVVAAVASAGTAAVLIAFGADPANDNPAGAPVDSAAAPAVAAPSAAWTSAPAALPEQSGAATTGTARPAGEGTAPPSPTIGPGPTPPASTAPPPAPGVTVQALGGVLRAQCAGKKAQALSLDTAAGYSVQEYRPGPADEVRAVLVAPANRSEIKVKCPGGKLSAEVKEVQPKP
ncbi:serine/threonine-protein kinase [Dactylosporangium sp. NPDC005555]|uniref:serine/threonine-protein kinase n=1 Tax=Dactylosporangium sp. NPDC005555 TaxID=3154889 RepID=UPI0033AD0EF5